MSLLRELIEQQYKLKGTGKWFKPERGEPSSLVYNSEQDLFFWNSHGIAGDALTWLVKVLGYSFNDAKEYLKSHETFSGAYTIAIHEGKEVVALPRLVDAFWEAGKTNREYWYNRGFKDSTIDRFQLGFHNDWYIIPVFVDGSLRNFQMRKDIPQKSISNWYRGVGPLLYNSTILKLTSSVVITEGPTDAILLNQEGFPAVSHTGGAGGWKEIWNKYFTNQREIYYIADYDSAGMEGAKRVAENLGEYRVKILDWERLFSNELEGRTLFKGYDSGELFRELSTPLNTSEFRRVFSLALSKYTKRIFQYGKGW